MRRDFIREIIRRSNFPRVLENDERVTTIHRLSFRELVPDMRAIKGDIRVERLYAARLLFVKEQNVIRTMQTHAFTIVKLGKFYVLIK